MVAQGPYRVSGGELARRDSSSDEVYEANERVFRLDLQTLRRTAFEGDWRTMPLPAIKWPRAWRPLTSQERTRDVSDGLARSVEPAHPLLVDEYEPMATTGDGAPAVLDAAGVIGRKVVE